MNRHFSDEMIAAYLDKKLSIVEKTGFEKHLSECEECLSEIVELHSILKGKKFLPSEFLNFALSGNKKKLRNWILLVIESAALFMIVIFLGYQFWFKNRFVIDRNSTKSSEFQYQESKKETTISGNINREFKREENLNKFKSDFDKKNSISEYSKVKSSNKNINTGKEVEYLPEPGRNEMDEQRQKDKLSEQLLEKKPLEAELKGQTNTQVTKNVFPTLPGPAVSQQNIQLKSPQAIVFLQKCFRLEGDAREEDILNSQLLCDFIGKKEKLFQGVILWLEIMPNGKVTKAYAESAFKNDSFAALIDIAKNTIFIPSISQIRKVKITFR